MSKGRIKYVPANIIQELENIKHEENVEKDSEAFRKLAEFSILGRQTKKEQWIFFNNFKNKK